MVVVVVIVVVAELNYIVFKCAFTETTSLHMNTHTHAHTHAHIHTRTHTHTKIYTHTHIHTHKICVYVSIKLTAMSFWLVFTPYRQL